MRETESKIADFIACAAQTLATGGIVGYPTETVWGLAASPDQPEAIAKLYALKGRQASKPVQISCVTAVVARELTSLGSIDALLDLWPGPFTVVVPASDSCPPALAPCGLVGLRVPDHPIALMLLRACGGWLATTSLNPSGESPARTLAEAQMYGLADMLLPDGGVPAQGEASTVVRIGYNNDLTVLRDGAFSVSILQDQLCKGEHDTR